MLKRTLGNLGFWRSKSRAHTLSRRVVLVESLEPRCVMDAAPIHVGLVYIETDYLEASFADTSSDQGDDSQADQFLLSFIGGAPGTTLDQVIIDLDKDGDGLSIGDSIFDTAAGGRGKAGFHPFKVVNLTTSDSHGTVTAQVDDGGSKLLLNLTNFHAGDKLVFSLDVDEVLRLSNDLTVFNSRLDVITSGQEFHDSILNVSFSAPHYYEVTQSGIFVNDYGDPQRDLGINLPPDSGTDKASHADRTAAALFTVNQAPKPISIAGNVYLDNDLNLKRDASDPGIAGVELELFRWDDATGRFVSTSHRTVTDSAGRYEFGTDLKLMPGTFRVVETQPQGLLSVGAVPGTVNGQSTGTAATDDVLTDIELPLGDLYGINYDFAEAQPASISGFVYQDDSDDGVRDPGERGLGGVTVELIPVDTLVPSQTRVTVTADDGSYQFTDLSPGQYRIVETKMPHDLSDGLDTAGKIGGITVGAAINPGDEIGGIKLLGGSIGTQYNFGELPLGSLSGFVYLVDPGYDCFEEDLTHSTPLDDVRVDLLDASGTLVATTYTDAAGAYAFERLVRGRYTIVEHTPNGLIDGSAHVGMIGGSVAGTPAGGSKIDAIGLVPGGDGTNYNFCETAPAILSGHVYHDRMNNGNRDPSDSPLADVLIELLDTQGRVVASQRTDSQGYYEFPDLLPGTYTIRETTPARYTDGLDRAGTVDGRNVGKAINPGDRIVDVVLGQGQQGKDFDFGELLSSTLSGFVYVDTDGDCVFDPDEAPLAGVTMQLYDEAGQLIGTTTTDETGQYEFLDLLPGQYTVVQIQPDGYFNGSQIAGTTGGNASRKNQISAIPLEGGDHSNQNNFCEAPPATISGYVFQDGAVRDGLAIPSPEHLREIADGVFSPDDIPLAGVVLELRNVLGQAFLGQNALPGVYPDGPIRVMTDASGYYEFRGLAGGTYHVYQMQPDGYIDGLDTAGTLGGYAVNAADQPADDATTLSLKTLALSSSTDPGDDGIILIDLPRGGNSQTNNFSEIAASNILPPPPPPPIVPPNQIPDPVIAQFPFAPLILNFSSTARIKDPIIADYEENVTWHLSVIDAGFPRGVSVLQSDGNHVVKSAGLVFDASLWSANPRSRGIWRLMDQSGVVRSDSAALHLGDKDATALAGDFNGDGRDELAIYVAGNWFIDVNGNGIWDGDDLWIRLGTSLDLPVVGDWDGDGKDDVGIFGPQWQRDPEAIVRDPGLPDGDNQRRMRPKNQPPSVPEATDGQRYLQLKQAGNLRGDLIDHVFRYGRSADVPLAGDWNGDGIDAIAVFRAGRWMLDSDGDGRWTERDEVVHFGQAGDIPVVGDWNGDGISDPGVVRGNQWIIDSDGDRQLTDADKRFEQPAGTQEAQPVAGDWDGDGTDEAGSYETSDEPSTPNRAA